MPRKLFVIDNDVVGSLAKGFHPLPQAVQTTSLGPYNKKGIGINYFRWKGGDVMANTYYSIEFKKMATELVLIGKRSTIETAKKLNVPLKTFEKWITAYNKNGSVLKIVGFNA